MLGGGAPGSRASCGPLNIDDNWALLLFADVAYERIDGDNQDLRRALFPLGLELRINLIP